MKELQDKVNEEQSKECTFVPMTTTSKRGGSPRPSSVISGQVSARGGNSPDQSVTHKASKDNDIQIYFKKESSDVFEYPGTNKNTTKQRAKSRQNTAFSG